MVVYRKERMKYLLTYRPTCYEENEAILLCYDGTSIHMLKNKIIFTKSCINMLLYCLRKA